MQTDVLGTNVPIRRAIQHDRQIHLPLCRDHLPGRRRTSHPTDHLRPQCPWWHRPSVLHDVPGATNLPRGFDPCDPAGGEVGMSKTFSVEPCTYKALMRPRWSRDDGPRVFVCTRCGRCVPGYERLWLERERLIQKAKEEHQKDIVNKTNNW